MKPQTPSEQMLSALSTRNSKSRLNWVRILHLAQTHAEAATLAKEPGTLRTALHIAVSEFVSADYVGFLISRGARLSAKCCCDQTPLVLAISRGNVAAVHVLARAENDSSVVAQAFEVARWMDAAVESPCAMTTVLEEVGLTRT